MSHGQNHHANVIGSGGFWKVKLLDVYEWNTLDFNCTAERAVCYSAQFFCQSQGIKSLDSVADPELLL